MIKMFLYASIILSTTFLSVGFIPSEYFWVGIAYILAGIIWIILQARGFKLASTIGFCIFIFGAALGAEFHLPPLWMILAAVFALAAWDISAFEERIQFSVTSADTETLTRIHFTRLFIILAIGVTLPLVALNINIRELRFELFAGLVLLAVIGLTRALVYLRKN